MSIKDWPVNERPREKLLAHGAHSLSDAELLAVLLGGSGRRGLHAVAMVRELLCRHQSLRGQALARNAAAVILAHNHPLCCPAAVTTVSGVTGFGDCSQLGTRDDR